MSTYRCLLITLLCTLSACGVPTVEKDGGKKVLEHVKTNLDEMRESFKKEFEEKKLDQGQYSEYGEMQLDRILKEGGFSTPLVIDDSAKEFFSNPTPATDCRFVFAFGWSIYCYASVEVQKPIIDMDFISECLDKNGTKIGDDTKSVSITNENAIIGKKIELSLSSIEDCWEEDGTQLRIAKK
jgi:hypothetical protein